MPDLIDQTSVPPNTFTASSNMVYGNEFHVGGDGFLATHLSFYWGANTGSPPAYLELFDAVSGAIMEDVAVGILTSSGWYSYPLANTVALVSGRLYTVAAFWNNPPCRFYNYNSTQVPESPLAYDSSRITIASSVARDAYPTDVSNNEVAVSVTVSGPSSGEIATTGDVETSLSSWLISTGDNTHQADGLPWITHTLLAILTGSDGSQVGDFNLLQVFPPEYRSLYGALRELFELVGGVAGVIALVNGIRNLTPGLTITDAFNALTSQVDANSGTLATLIARTDPFNPLTWTLSEETDFDTSLAWAATADLYRVTVTTIPDTRPITVVAGVSWVPRLFWWSPLNGTFAGTRYFGDFAQQDLYLPGYTFPGLLLDSLPGTLGHVQAWLRPA